jgi:hypothetical protein
LEEKVAGGITMAETDRPTEQEMEKYREDVKTIREILVSVDKQPLYENWVFHAWGILLILGSCIHYAAVSRFNVDRNADFLLVWLPVLLIAAGLEFASYLRNSRRLALPFFTREFFRIFAGLTGSTGVLIFIVIIFNQAGIPDAVPVVLLLGVVMFYFLIGQHMSYARLLPIGFGTLAAAVVIYVLRLDWALTSLLAGIFAGISLIIAGVVSGRTLHAV